MPYLFLNTERGFGRKTTPKIGVSSASCEVKNAQRDIFHGALPLESGLAARARCLGFLAGVAAVSRPRSSATATMQLYFRRSGTSRSFRGQGYGGMVNLADSARLFPAPLG